MNEVILDCDLMRFRNSGLYHYCLNLGNYVQSALQDKRKERIRFYVPPREVDAFDRKENCIAEKSWHRFYRPFLRNCRVWHAPFQSGRILPSGEKRKHMKVLLTIHDLNCLHEDKSVEEQKKAVAHTQSLINLSDAIVCISEFTKKDVLINCDVQNKPVYVIHNGRNTLHSPALIASSYQPRRPFLFGMGYVNRKKNYKVLLSLLKENEDIELLIAGRLDEPDYIKSMQQTAKVWGVADRFRLLGPVTEGEKAWYLSHCKAFMHPSLAEGFGFPVIEAMTFGKPVFLSGHTSLPEIGGNAAFYFSSFNPEHMQYIYHQGMQRYGLNGMSKLIKERGEQFDWEKSAAQYIEIYQSLF